MIDPKVLIALVDRLDSYPVGLPDAPEIREFLNIFLTPDEARLASLFPLKEVTAAELAARAGWPVDKVEALLEAMASKGTVFDYQVAEGGVFWLLTPSVVGFIEFSLMKLHKDMPHAKIAGLLEAYERSMRKEVFGSATQISRALVGFDVPVSSQIMTRPEIEKLIRTAGGGTAQACFCRQKKRLLGKPCGVAAHEETCFTISASGSSFIERRGFGVRISAEEMIRRVRELGKLGLIHVTDNIRGKPSFICNCCGCCCGLLAGITEAGIPQAVAPTQYILAADAARCSGCGACVPKCQIRALSLKEGKAAVDEKICLGCGACVKFCGSKALALAPRPRPPRTPGSEAGKFLRIAWEKGKLPALLFKLLKARLYL
jgi:ferredoxin